MKGYCIFIFSTREDIANVCSLGDLEVKFKLSQSGATREHTLHVGDLGSVEVRQIEGGQRGATREHVVHVLNT